MNRPTYEQQYMDALIDIYEHGYEDGMNTRTGLSTKRLPGIVIQVDVEKEFPILKSKFVAGKTALREILWIWQQQSNRLSDLHAKIWDSWGKETTSNKLVWIDHPNINMEKYAISDTLQHALPDDINQYERHSSRSYGDYIILKQCGALRTIQFLNTGNIVEHITLDQIKQGSIMDYYARSCHNLGYYGDYKSNDILEYFGQYHHRWVDIWRGIMRRCAKGTGIYQHTLCSNNFTSCEFFLRWVMQNNRYKDKSFLGILQIDKDYYNYNFYSEDTCTILTPAENNSLVKSKWYIYHNKTHDEIFFSKYQLAEFLETKTNHMYIQYKDGRKNGINSKLKKTIQNLVEKGILDIVDPHKTNNGQLLRFDLTVDHTIGKAYGYQMARPVTIYADPVNKKEFRSYENQTQYILEYLREFPTGRWGVATLWNPSELANMNLVPCCHTSTWNLDGGRLNCVLDQRSGDFPYGVPFNTTQYAELMILLARDLGVKPGILTHVIADAHIYDNQMEGVKTQIQNHLILCAAKPLIQSNKLTEKTLHKIVDDTDASIKIDKHLGLIEKIITCKPEFVVNTTDTSFWNVKPEDCSIANYENCGKISFGDIAV